MSMVVRELDGLTTAASGANKEHGLAEVALSTWLDHAIKAGEILWEVRQQFAESPGGGWVQWVEENLDFSAPTANAYIRAFFHRDRLRAKSVKGMRGAFRETRGLPGPLPLTIGWGSVRSIPTDLKDIAQDLRRRGYSYQMIGEVLNVSRSTIRDWLSPDVARAYRERKTHRSRRAKAARRALQREELRQTARDLGRDPEKVYTTLRETLLPSLDAWIQETDDTEARAGLLKVRDWMQRSTSQVDKVLRLVGK